MLFILIMDVMGHMFSKATADDMLQPLARRALPHQILIYVDDVVLFIQPEENGIALTMDIMHLFGTASGLKTNLQKSNVLPIHCEEQDLHVVQQQLPCALADFLLPYQSWKEHLQPIIDRMADLLPGWKADLLTRAGRKIHVQFVLTATIIYLAMALDLPQWAHKAMDKIQWSYFWRGHKEANGGHCLIAWDKVCRTTDLDGLGISNLRLLGWALRAHWLWLKKTEPHRPWASLDIQVPDQVQAFFRIAICP
jgi:hypothetical protein